MNAEQLQTLIHWLQSQINHANSSILESQQINNLGREAQYEGMRDAFQRCLKQLGNK